MITNTNKNNIFKKRVGILLHPFLILFIPIFGVAQYDFDADMIHAYQHMSYLRTTQAKNILNKHEQPSNKAIVLLIENYIDVIEVFCSEDIDIYNTTKKNGQNRINELKKLSTNSAWHLHIQAEILIQWALIKFKMQDEVNAILDIKKANQLLKTNHEKYPHFAPTKKSYGMLLAIFSTIPSNYNWALKILGFKADLKEGLKLMDEAVCEGDVFYLEASLVYLGIQSFITNIQQNLDVEWRSLLHMYPKNPMLVYLYSVTLLKRSEADKALKVINDSQQETQNIKIPFIELIKGEALLSKGAYKEARIAYLQFLEQYKGVNSLKDTYLKIFYTYHLNNETDKGKPYFDKVSNIGKTLYDSDKHAQKVVDLKVYPSIPLTKVRFHTDGGYFKEAQAVLDQLHLGSFDSKKDKIEYLYRVARLYHKQGKLSQAKTYYDKTIEISAIDDELYFAPNSCLQLGYIYLYEKNHSIAKNYFEKALGYKNYDYKNSIENKAKGALQSME